MSTAKVEATRDLALGAAAVATSGGGTVAMLNNWGGLLLTALNLVLAVGGIWLLIRRHRRISRMEDRGE